MKLYFKELDFKELSVLGYLFCVLGYSDLLGLGVLGYSDLLEFCVLGYADLLGLGVLGYSDLLGLGVPDELLLDLLVERP
jgi:hypothetical protein